MYSRGLTFGLVASVVLCAASSTWAALCALETRAITSANGKYLLVLLTPAGEEESRWEGTLAEQDRIEAQYSKSGLYRNDGSTELLWPIDYLSTAKEIYVCNDGVHLVVTFLDWNSGISDRGHALEFYKNGNLQAIYDEQELLPAYYTRLVTSGLSGRTRPEGVAEMLDEDRGTYAFETNWGDAFQFDIATGKLLNSRMPWALKMMVGSLFGLLLLFAFTGWCLWSRAARRKHVDLD